eukprot:COSAG02_NODE_10542_length_1918_cov_1.631666_2_plen_198_part_00
MSSIRCFASADTLGTVLSVGDAGGSFDGSDGGLYFGATREAEPFVENDLGSAPMDPSWRCCSAASAFCSRTASRRAFLSRKCRTSLSGKTSECVTISSYRTGLAGLLGSAAVRGSDTGRVPEPVREQEKCKSVEQPVRQPVRIPGSLRTHLHGLAIWRPTRVAASSCVGLTKLSARRCVSRHSLRARLYQQGSTHGS